MYCVNEHHTPLFIEKFYSCSASQINISIKITNGTVSMIAFWSNKTQQRASTYAELGLTANTFVLKNFLLCHQIIP